MLLSDLSAEDFKTFKQDSIAIIEYSSLSQEEQAQYEVKYKSNFEKEFKKLRSQLVEDEKIDKTTAGQIMLKEIKDAHSKGSHFMSASGNIDVDKFKQIRVNIEKDVKSGKYDNLILRNQQNEEIKESKKETINTFEQKVDEIKQLLSNYTDLSEEEKKEVRNSIIKKLVKMSNEDRANTWKKLNCSDDEIKQLNKLCELDKYIEEHKKEYLEQHPELDENENSEEIEKALRAQFCKENNIDPQELDDIEVALGKKCEISSLEERIEIINKSGYSQVIKEQKVAEINR